MKIRTDFVTNSSSYCTAEVIIDNPVLLEILQEYKDMGLFGQDDPIIGVGDYKIYGYSETYEYLDDSNRPKIPAFYLYNDDGDEDLRHLGLTDETTPRLLDEVLLKIIEILNINELWLDKEIQVNLIQELTSRQAEINQAYKSVDWSCEFSYERRSETSFTYDQVNGSNFQSSNEEQNSRDEGDDVYDEEE